jgi:hypothetical protein
LIKYEKELERGYNQKELAALKLTKLLKKKNFFENKKVTKYSSSQ